MTENQNAEDLLIEEEIYLTSGVHIGTQQKSADMKDFIFKVRSDGLYVLDIKKTDERLRVAARMISRYNPEDVLVVSARQYGQKPVREFSNKRGCGAFPGRFVPGTLTNPSLDVYTEPRLLMVTDPTADQQALREAVSSGIPILGLCVANNEIKYVRGVLEKCYNTIQKSTLQANSQRLDFRTMCALTLDMLGDDSKAKSITTKGNSRSISSFFSLSSSE